MLETPFRFAVQAMGGTREATIDFGQQVESWGFDTIVMGDHLRYFADSLTTLMFLADHTESVRIGSWVFCNDFHHPVVLARSLASLDELSGGRLDIGLGAGYLRAEYESSGIYLDSGAVRFARLKEATTIVKAMLTESPVSFDGEYYHLTDQICSPLARQRPHPPLTLGGGGPNLLRWAAAEADIVSIIPRAGSNGNLQLSAMTGRSAQAFTQIIHNAMTDRSDKAVLNSAMVHIGISNNRVQAAQDWLDSIRNKSNPLAILFDYDQEIAAEDILDSPFLAFGTADEVAEHLVRMRSETGISYWVIAPNQTDEFLPVLERLKAGQE
jgi:probable F420-dependent oxidoreductase